MNDLDHLAEDIARSGIRNIFGIPGSGPSLTLLDALEKRDVSFHLTHFEGTAAIMAGVQGKLAEKAGVAISIKGPGLSNMIPGLAVCRLEALPVVSISEAYPPNSPSHKAHKRMDHQTLVSEVSKGSRYISQKGPFFPDLASWALAEIPGPVQFNILGSAIEKDTPISYPSPNGASGSHLDRVIKTITSAQKPVIIAGTFALRKKLSHYLNTLAVPVFSVASAKGVVDETLPHSAGVYTGVGLDLTPEFKIIPQADLIIGIGLRHQEVLGVKHFPSQSINIDPLGETFCEGFHFDLLLNGTPEELDVIFSTLNEKTWGLEELEKSLEMLKMRMVEKPFMPANAFQIIEGHFKHSARLVLDTGNFCTIGEHVWRVRKPEWYLGSGQSRYMGAGLPMALGAAIYDPHIPTVVFLGDGGIGMFIADLKLALLNKLPLVIVHMSDSYFGSIRFRSIKDGLTQKPVTIHHPSWVNVVEGMEVHAAQIQKEDEIEPVLQIWDPADGPIFLEMSFDPDRYQRMVDHIR